MWIRYKQIARAQLFIFTSTAVYLAWIQFFVERPKPAVVCVRFSFLTAREKATKGIQRKLWLESMSMSQCNMNISPIHTQYQLNVLLRKRPTPMRLWCGVRVNSAHRCSEGQMNSLRDWNSCSFSPVQALSTLCTAWMHRKTFNSAEQRMWIHAERYLLGGSCTLILICRKGRKKLKFMPSISWNTFSRFRSVVGEPLSVSCIRATLQFTHSQWSQEPIDFPICMWNVHVHESISSTQITRTALMQP